MIELLRIQSLGIISESLLELGPGLNTITGETGAGKTMLVTALGLLAGKRADASLVRHGERTAKIEATINAPSALLSQAQEHGAEVEDNQLLLARHLLASGRSRAYVGGSGVPAAVLGRIADQLVVMHGQADQYRLLQPAHQRQLLDQFGGEELQKVAEAYSRLYQELRDVEDELTELTSAARERAREADALRLGIADIDGVSPDPELDGALVEEESRLAHAEALAHAAAQARALLTVDAALGGASLAAHELVAQAHDELASVSHHDSQAAELAHRLEQLGHVLADIASDVGTYLDRVQVDPQRLEQVSQRRAALAGLHRKYGATIDEVLHWRAEAEQRLAQLDGTDGRIEQLTHHHQELTERAYQQASLLSRLRSQAATTLSAAVTAELAALAMPDAEFAVQVVSAEMSETSPANADEEHEAVDQPDNMSFELGPHGFDTVEFLLAPNKGSPARPLNKGASGGELSRVMLAIEVVLAGTTAVPTYIFDEVDAGVGGQAAVELGRRLARLATHAQVLVVTHLPQVAAFADRHILVQKADDGAVTTSGLSILNEEERVVELSRMLTGLSASAASLRHARELLQVAQEERQQVAQPGRSEAQDTMSHVG